MKSIHENVEGVNWEIRYEEHDQNNNQHDRCLLPLGSYCLVFLSLRLTGGAPERGDDVFVQDDHDDERHQKQENTLQNGDDECGAGMK